MEKLGANKNLECEDKRFNLPCNKVIPVRTKTQGHISLSIAAYVARMSRASLHLKFLNGFAFISKIKTTRLALEP